MGRLKKYHTKKEQVEAHRKRNREYYWRNKEKIDELARNRYRKKVGKKLLKL